MPRTRPNMAVRPSRRTVRPFPWKPAGPGARTAVRPCVHLAVHREPFVEADVRSRAAFLRKRAISGLFARNSSSSAGRALTLPRGTTNEREEAPRDGESPGLSMPREEQIRLGLGQTASQRQSSPRAAGRFGVPVRNTRWEAVVGAHLRSAPEPSYTSARMTRPLDGNDTVQEQRRRLGRRLRTLRVDSNMTQEALADRIGSAPQTLSDLENGRGRRAPARPCSTLTPRRV